MQVSVVAFPAYFVVVGFGRTAAVHLTVALPQLTSPQSINSEVEGSLTIKRSLGLLPVLLPVSISKAPVSVSFPSAALYSNCRGQNRV